MLYCAGAADKVAAGAGLLIAGRGKHKSRLRNMQALSRPEPSDDQENVGAELVLPACENNVCPHSNLCNT